MELLKLLQRGVHLIGRGEMSNRKKFVGGNIHLHLLYIVFICHHHTFQVPKMEDRLKEIQAMIKQRNLNE